MKTFFALAALVAGSLAQRINISAPALDQIITAGKPFTVELGESVSQSSVQETSVSIALAYCQGDCFTPGKRDIATVLYNGPFVPLRNASRPQDGPFQDFQFTLPANTLKGRSLLQVAHYLNLGAARTPTFEYAQVEVNIA